MRLIDADAYLESVRPRGLSDDAWKESHIYKSITNAPTIEERPHGEWEFVGDNLYMCTECGYTANANWLSDWKQYTYDDEFPCACPKCGASMSKLQANDEQVKVGDKGCPCDTCKHFGENGAVDPVGEEYCPLDPFCEYGSLYEKMGGDEE